MNYNEIATYLQMQPHPEGGFYKETYRCEEKIDATKLAHSFSGERNIATGIYFMLLKNNFSAFHRIKSDEIWHFYSGGSLSVHVIHPNGKYELIQLGNQLEKGEVFQAMVPAASWFASECAPNVEFSLVGCTVAPGFDFADFELAESNALTQIFPEHETIIKRLCRQ